MDSAAKRSTIPVAIVGGGPVGLVLALFLDRYGVRSVLFNSEAGPAGAPQGQHAECTDAGAFPAPRHIPSLCADSACRSIIRPTSPTSPDSTRGSSRASACRLRLRRCAPSPLRLRPIRSQSRYCGRTRCMSRRSCSTMHARGPISRCASAGRSTTLQWKRKGLQSRRKGAATERANLGASSYVVGCDGGHSYVRRLLGIHYPGYDRPAASNTGRPHDRDPSARPSLYRDDPAVTRAWHVLGRRRRTPLLLDSRSTGTTSSSCSIPSRKPGAAARGRDRFAHATRATRRRGRCPTRMLGHRPWTGGAALVSERFGEGACSSQATPYICSRRLAAFGMNTGIDDVANLSWKLAATLQGWGGASLVDSYELERKPVAVRNTIAARELAKRNGTIPTSPAMEEDNAEGEAARRRVGAHLSTFGEAFSSIGLQLGVRYDGSPIIVPDGAPLADNFARYTPSSVPGGRAPHIWLDERRGRGSFTLRSLGHRLHIAQARWPRGRRRRARAAARRRGVPLDVLDHPATQRAISMSAISCSFVPTACRLAGQPSAR